MSLEELVFGKQSFEDVDEETEKKTSNKAKAPAWIDPDDIQLVVNPKQAKIAEVVAPVTGEQLSEALKNRYTQITDHINLEWTKSEAVGRDVVDTEPLFANSDGIPSGKLEIVRANDLFSPKSNRAGIRQIQFSPVDQTATVLDVNGTIHSVSYNEKHSSIVFSLPKTDSRHRYCFTYRPDGSSIFIGCGEGRFQKLDLDNRQVFNHRIIEEMSDIKCIKASPNNDFIAVVAKQTVHLIDPNNCSILSSVSTSDELVCGAFTQDGAFFITGGKGGSVTLFECETSTQGENLKALGRMQLVEQQTIRSLDISGSHIAFGNEKGVLTVFDMDELRSHILIPFTKRYSIKQPEALVTKMNLTTAIDTLCFNPTGELLVFASSDKIDSLKVLHLVSKSIFTNWPTQKTPLGYIRSVAFDNRSALMSFGNNKGICTMWSLPFYKA